MKQGLCRSALGTKRAKPQEGQIVASQRFDAGTQKPKQGMIRPPSGKKCARGLVKNVGTYYISNAWKKRISTEPIL